MPQKQINQTLEQSTTMLNGLWVDVGLARQLQIRMWNMVNQLVAEKEEGKEDDEEQENHRSVCDHLRLPDEGDTTRNQPELPKDIFSFSELAGGRSIGDTLAAASRVAGKIPATFAPSGLVSPVGLS